MSKYYKQEIAIFENEQRIAILEKKLQWQREEFSRILKLALPITENQAQRALQLVLTEVGRTVAMPNWQREAFERALKEVLAEWNM